MRTPGLAGLTVLLRLCVIVVVLLTSGSIGLVCYTAVESLDLSCLLRWDCPYASPNSTYTVQTKTQGDPWQDVPWCVWISSHSCDVSQIFSNFELYNMIRLGVHLTPTSTVWMEPRKFDYSDFTFSPPSVSVSLKEEQLLVKVQFPCTPNRRCSRERCCPISRLIDPWTTVTVYSELSPSEYQSRTVWTQEVMSHVEFSGLSLGHNYCVVANFSFPTFSMAASPKSAPQCVEVVSQSGETELMPVLCLGIALTLLLIFPLLTVFLRKPQPAATTPENQSKTPVHDLVSLVPLSLVPADPCDVHLELADDQMSIVSSSNLPSAEDLTSALGNAVSRVPLSHDPSSLAAYWDSGGIELELGLDSGISIPRLSH
ncbi:interleukin-22 receptor subunit alpha-2 [Mugil cephalus]|uniref:interleukin-22 receptor subunit alpha-2 n=1 Tax=Mugil cephalus TaxID=48193 RepID=UPI001FB6A6CF|nr:interleukin-22 receptor subunit alpha-2 [Mugil cephalus]